MNRWVIILILGLAVNVLMKVWKINEPIETDLMQYCMGGHTIFHGMVLYKDVLDQKPPLLHLIYGISEQIFGYGESQIFAINILFSSLVIFFAFLILKELKFSGLMVGCFLAFLILGLLSCLEIEANQPNSELILNGLLGLALLQSIRACQGKKIELGLFWFTAASLSFVKHHAIIPALCLALVNDKVNQTINWKSRFVLPSIASTISLWLCFFFFYYIYGHWHDMWMSLFAFNFTYNNSLSQTLIEAMAWHNVLMLFVVCIPPFLLLLKKEPLPEVLKNLSWLSLVFSLGSFVMLAAPGKWWPHYYQLMIWPYFFSFALMFPGFCRGTSFILKLLRGAIIGSIFWLSAHNLANFLKLSPEEISLKKYKGPWFIETKKVAPKIKELLKGDEWFFVWGQDPGLYVYTKIWPQTRMNTYFPFVFGGIQQYAYKKFFEEVAQDPPELVIFPRPQIGMIAPNLADPILNWIARNYFPISNGYDYEGYLVCSRLGGSVDLRMDKQIPRQPLMGLFIKPN